MIPPSVPMVIYGILAETDIAKLFIAGILPGILLIVLFSGCHRIHHLAPPRPRPPRRPHPMARTPAPVVAKVWGVVLIFVIIIGGIYGGLFTPTEAAGVGVFAAGAFAMSRGKLSWRALCTKA